MKKQELEDMIKSLNNIKDIINKENYNLSSAVNMNLIHVVPNLEKELERMNTEKVVINCPSLKLIDNDDDNLEKKLNEAIKELVLQDYKIIDFGMFGTMNNLSGYIKYTT